MEEKEERVGFLEETIRRLLSEKLELMRKVSTLEGCLRAQERSTGDRAGTTRDVDLDFLDQVGELVRPLIHDIKGQFPFVVGVIRTAIDYLQKNKCETDASGLIRRLVSCATTMEYLNMRMIGLSYLGGKTPDVFTRVDVNELVKANIGFVTGRYESAVIESDLGDDPLAVRGDKESLNQIVSNLLINAIEAYTSPRASVHIRTRRVLGETPRVELTVKDSGVGIYPSERAMIYDLHYTTKKTGFGIGLYLVKKAVELHGGEIECESEPNSYTSFRVYLPVGEGEQ